MTSTQPEPSALPGPGEWLVHGIAVDRSRTPVLRLTAEDRTVELALIGARLGYAVNSPDRWCLGHRDADGRPIPCPHGAVVNTGTRCARCEVADPYRWMHIVHRSPFLDPALREQVMQPHWLYVASFGPGLHKVGTAVDGRQWTRIAEQGALLAGYVALAEDGIEVRRLEDLVSSSTSLVQLVRPAAKAAALVAGATPQNLRTAIDNLIGEVRELLLEHGAGVLTDPWRPEPDPQLLLAGRQLHRYPAPPDRGPHGFTVRAVLGSSALVELDDDPGHTFVAELAPLKGRKIVAARTRTAAPAVQDGLF